MEIKTKYNIGDRVWVVNEADYYNNETQRREKAGVVEVFDDYIENILVCSNKGDVIYTLKQADMLEILEWDIILYDDKQALLERIEKVMKKIHDREKEKQNKKINKR